MSLSAFLEIQESPSTIRVYRSAVFHFLDLIYPKGEDDYETLAVRYVKSAMNGTLPHQDLLRFAAYLQARPPKTRQTYVNAVKNWLEFHGIDIKDSQRKAIARKVKGKAITQDRPISQSFLKSLRAHADLPLWSVVVFLASSGMRVSEVLKLLPSDVYLESDPAMVVVRFGVAAKGGPQRWTFLSHEAVDALQEWYKYRDTYIGNKRTREHLRDKDNKDKRIFPLTYSCILEMWNGAVEKAGYAERDKNTRRSLYHIHALRKYFRTQLGAYDEVERMMGHEGYLTDAYVRLTPEALAVFYKKHESRLWIDTPVVLEDAEAQKRIEHQEKKLNEIEQRYDALFKEMQRLNDLQYAELKKLVDDSSRK